MRTCSEVYNLIEEKVYGEKNTYISYHLRTMLNENEDTILIILDGAKRGSDIDQCKREHPGRVWDAGIAEQDMIGIAVGAALAGKRVFCQSYGPFLSLRALEQIYLDVAYNSAPVCILVTSVGLAAGEGVTHNTLMDVAAIRCIPDIQIYAPCDANQTHQIMLSYMEKPRPVYVRCAKASTPLIYRDFHEKIECGKARLLWEGRDAIFIAMGALVCEALEAAQRLDRQGVHVGVIDMFSLKPVDTEMILWAMDQTNILITVEDHGQIGGLGTIVSEVMSEHEKKVHLKKIGVPDEFTINGSAEQLYHYYKMNADWIEKICLEMIRIYR